MKRLCELVDMVVNNESCVVFKPQKDTRMDLISLGCFNGNEEMIRMTKGRTPEISLFYKDGTCYSYHFGEGSTTIISDNMQKQRELIRECAILDFGIVCDLSYASLPYQDEMFIANTLDVQSMSDADRGVSLVSGGGMSGHIKINSQIVAHDVHVKDVPGWFVKRGYHVSFDQDISKGLPCGKVFGECVPMKEYQISQMPHELSENKLVRFVQIELGYDKHRAADFLEGFGKASCMSDAQRALSYFVNEIRQTGLRVQDLSDDDLLQLGKRLHRLDMNILADFTEAQVESVVDFVQERQQKSESKSVDNVLADAIMKAGKSQENEKERDLEY